MTYKRKEEIGGATLYLGDSLEIIPELEPVDHILQDPPYEDELHKAIGRIRRSDGQEMIQSLGFDGVNSDREAIAKVCVEKSKGWVIMFTLAEGVRAWRDDLQAAGAKWDTTCFWIKPDSTPRMNGQGPARGAECFVTCWAGKGHRSWNGGGKRGIYTHLVNKDRQGEHPTEKPISLMSEIITDFTKPGQIILDGFLGSGSTGVACIKTGRKFIGIERDPKWFDLSCRRIEQAYKQPDFFVAEHIPKHVQPSMFSKDTK